jgi:glycolate oxidase FAD binding subunit
MTEDATPSTVDEVRAILERACRNRQRVSIRGAGTKPGWSLSASAADIELSMRRMNAVVAHRHGDLTATIQAGAALAAVNRELARHGQWIPLDPPFRDRATIGGIVAANDSGPRRHRYGAPRDLIIGVEFVRGDGVAAKAGGIVVKNVAGYDVGRLLTGSLGSLAVITSATFKLFPVSPESRTVVITDDRGGKASTERLCDVVAELASSQLTPTAIELSGLSRLLVRFESVAASVERQAADATKLQAEVTAAVVSGADESALWDAHDARIWEKRGAVVKLALLATDVGPTLTWMAESLRDVDYDVVGRAALAILFVRIDAVVAKQAAFVRDLRSRLAPGRGSAVIVRGSADLEREVGVWGPLGDTAAVMRAIKTQLDPDGILPWPWGASV